MTIRLRLIVLLLLSCLSAAAIASGGGASSSAHERPDAGTARNHDYENALRAIKANDYASATLLLISHVRANPDDADGWNWLGYASRKTGNLKNAFAAYEKALAIDPKHKGAHEYLGEAYLLDNNLPKAQEQLTILDDLCWLPCEEIAELRSAIADYTRQHATR